MKRKQKNKKFIIIAVALLLLISIGYATISTTLTINGTASVSATSWNVYFTNLQVTSGSVTPSVAPTIDDGSTSTTSLSYTVTLDKPGDFYEFTVDVKNGGTINAKIADNGVSNTALTTEQDVLANYTVTYLDGTTISAGDKLSKKDATIDGISDTRTIKVRVEYDTNITPAQLNALEDDLTLNLEFSLEYVQD